MIKVPRKPAKRPLETTISLINIVFLMLIFFLVAGRLAPPQDPEVTLSQAEKADPLPPPDALYARIDGTLHYREQPLSAEDYMSRHAAAEETPNPLVRLAADESLKAEDLLRHVGALYRAGAGRVVIVTRTQSE
ncbi:biopolymer transporter ExbD [Labrenzia sp. OB1]|uniref:ExbD/TolR family protein n=1 Tax=Labrenzia sp. OB1 TaxID=1561204 RepID=UPI0007B1D69B|nr:biopolymer transporter ExbD [Labrenzia sp. OB1]KZM51946.1 biopolymer transporter ExbD [Labrenzia sp. OB1]